MTWIDVCLLHYPMQCHLLYIPTEPGPGLCSRCKLAWDEKNKIEKAGREKMKKERKKED